MHPTNECTQNHLPQPHATTCMCWLPPQGTFEIFDFASKTGGCASETGGLHGPHGLEACLALHIGPQWSGLANTCLGLLSACVGTVPCTWLRHASLFWHANSFWLPLERFLRTPAFWRFFAVFGQLPIGPW